MVNRVIRKSLYIGLLLAGVLVSTNNVYADDDATDFSITVNPSLNLRVSSSSVGFGLTPSKNGTFDSASFNVYSSTNNSTGYTLTMSTDNVNLVSDTINPTTGTEPTIPTLAETTDGISAAAFEASTSSDVLNHYGISIAGANYNAMKDGKEIKKTEENNIAEDTTVISLASKLDLNTVPGVYSTTIVFGLVANPQEIPPSGVSGGDITDPSGPGGAGFDANTLGRSYEIYYVETLKKSIYVKDDNDEEGYHLMQPNEDLAGRKVYFAMQDMSPTICSRVTVAPDQLQVMDLRDAKVYWIAKLADGNCWMTQNLDLNLVHGKPLTHADSDIGWGTDTSVDSWDPENSTASISSFVEDNSNPYSVDVGDWYWIGNWLRDGVSTYYNTNSSYMYLTSGANEHFQQFPFEGNGAHGHLGNYYNWTAAIASNDSSSYNSSTLDNVANSPQNSICPAGWRLPIITNMTYGEEGTNEFNNLYQKHFNYNTYQVTDEAITAAPLYYVRAGAAFSYGTPTVEADETSYLWSSTVRNGQNVYSSRYFSRSVGYVYADTAGGRFPGVSIRCIAR